MIYAGIAVVLVVFCQQTKEANTESFQTKKQMYEYVLGKHLERVVNPPPHWKTSVL